MEEIPPPHIQAQMLSELSAAFAPDGVSPIEVERPVLYLVYGSDIGLRLGRILAHVERDETNGYLVVSVQGRSPGYVTCQFTDGDKTLSCEATPGNYPPKPGDSIAPLSAKTTEALEEAGYRRNSEGRYLFPFEIWQEPDDTVWGAAAVTIMNPLIDAFGLRAGSKVEIIAPLAPERDDVAIRAAA